ncbi:glycosyltransferase family 4 protein [Christiangramia salexigens]|uniref:Glycosyl transferase family 1 domain-containing protein n=1 Tax=Christiangramia salexigens TaxID=1913577 RepID=A0A1L3J1U1_9FLAO|nr:glycosyltransferase family 4 protein [Christiangramia salexigens]APG59112.1 hypothetical protein LPB144_01240 [Christiangramia salexigens]
MKILFYVHSSTLYGANRSLIELILGLRDKENTITHVIVPSDGPIVSELQKFQIEYSVIPHYNWFYNNTVAEKWKKKSTFLFFFWMNYNRLIKALGNKKNLNHHLSFLYDFKPDLLYVNSSLAPMGAIVAQVTGLPFIWHHRETVNDFKTEFYLESDKEFKKLYQKANYHVFASRFLEQYYLDKYGKKNCLVKFNGIRLPSSIDALKIFNPKNIHFGMVGRVNKQKGQDDVINVFKHINSLEKVLHIYGGADKLIMKKLQSYSKIKNIFYHNFEERRKIYSALDFIIVNSQNEAFGRVVVEANSYGIPVIAKNSGAIPEIVKDGTNGWLFNTKKELEQIIIDKSNLTPENYNRISKNAKKFAQENFDLNSYTNEIYKRLCKVIKDHNYSQ